MSESVTTLVDAEGVARVTLTRPEKHNAFDEVVIAELQAALDTLAVSEAVRAVVLQSEGPSFCAGADLDWMRRSAGYAPADNVADARRLARLLHTLDTLPHPVVARVQGAAFGGGVGLVACADVAVCARSAQFALSEVRLGLIPSVVSPYLVAAVGRRQARRLVVTGERFDATEARRIGLVHHVRPDAELDTGVSATLEALLGNGPDAVRAAKALIHRVGTEPADEALRDYTAARIAEIRGGEEAREGIAAFLDRRPPRWRRG